MMISALNFSCLATLPAKSNCIGGVRCQFLSGGLGSGRICSLSPSASPKSRKREMHRHRSSLESRFCYDKPIPEERIEKPLGLSMLSEIEIGDNQRCSCCEAKGAVFCDTCSGSGLYIDSIMECQGIIVKVRCLGCGGTGSIMCSNCGGRGHLGH